MQLSTGEYSYISSVASNFETLKVTLTQIHTANTYKYEVDDTVKTIGNCFRTLVYI